MTAPEFKRRLTKEWRQQSLGALLVIGLGLLRAARTGDDRDLHRWLVARAACDAGDLVAVALAVRSGERDRRFLALGALAAGAAAFGAALARAAR